MSGKFSEWRDDARRAFREFLAVPACVLIVFVVLAIATTAADGGWIESLKGLREVLQKRIFSDPKVTGDLLGTIASSMIAMTSFSFGLLLLAVQQTAASMTSHVIDQFLRRRINQLYFGFFVGLALYALIILATASATYTPVIGAAIALALVSVALCLLILLLYTTINQMRPAVVIEALHDFALAARRRQLGLLRRTRRGRATPGLAGRLELPVNAAANGYVVNIELAALGQALTPARDGAEVVLLVAIGSFVACGDALALVRTQAPQQAETLRKAALAAVRLEQQRDLERDAAYAIEQMTTIGWTSISTSKSNPGPGLLAVRGLRDLLARWSDEGPPCGTAGDDAGDGEPLPVVYSDDVPARLMDAFETLAVASTESMQHQNFAEVLRAQTALMHRLPPELQSRAADLILRILSGLGDHILTADLEHALDALAEALGRAGQAAAAHAVSQARQALHATLGKLNSRSSRVES